MEDGLPTRHSKKSSNRDLLTEMEVFAFQHAACLCFWRCRLLVVCPQSLGISPKFLCAVWQFASHSCFDELTAAWLGGGLELCFPSWFMNKGRVEFSSGTNKSKSSYKNPQVLFFCVPAVLLKSLSLITAELFLVEISEKSVCRYWKLSLKGTGCLSSGIAWNFWQLHACVWVCMGQRALFVTLVKN